MRKVLVGMWWFGDPISSLRSIFPFAPTAPLVGSAGRVFNPFCIEISFVGDHRRHGGFSGEGFDSIGKFSVGGRMEMGSLRFSKMYDPAGSRSGARFPIKFKLKNEGTGWFGTFEYDEREGAEPKAGQVVLVSRNTEK